MKRLFCLGDSFVDWDVPEYHWTYYLSKHYEVHKLGKYGADNYSILFQLGNLPEYEEEDRIVIVFTNPGRLPRRYYGERKKEFIEEKYHAPMFYRNRTHSLILDLLRHDEEQRWIKGERDIEISFLKNLKKWLSNYRPIFVTWSAGFYTTTSDFVNLIEASSNWEERAEEKGDFHPGPKGCYTWYEELHTLLEIEESKVEFEYEDKKKDMI